MSYINDDEDEEINHESFGTIQISRCSGSRGNGSKGIPLFDSPVTHHHFISLSILRCKVLRSHHHSRRYPGKELIEVLMSPSQFAEMITTMNVGEGTACTINHINGKSVASPPEGDNPHHKIHTEFVKRMNDVADKFKTDIDALRTRFNDLKPINKTERTELLGKLEQLEQEWRQNLPWVHECFAEATEKTVQIAKTEINHHATIVSAQTGIPVKEVRLIGYDDSKERKETS